MTTLTAVYDFESSPLSYDGVVFLLNASIIAEQHGFEHIHIVFIPGKHFGHRQDLKPNSLENRDWRLSNLMVPLCRLIRASFTMCPSRDAATRFLRNEPTWPGYHPDQKNSGVFYGQLKKFIEMGHKLPRLQADPEATRLVKLWRRSERPYVTITYRNATYSDARNSNMAAWSEFVDWLREADRFDVVEIPDTENAGVDCGLGGAAALNPLIRHALYAGAHLNLGVNSGPMGLCYLTDEIPYLMIKMVANTYSTTPQFFARYGLPVGAQYPWATTRQRIVWEDDSFAAIKRNFEEIA